MCSVKTQENARDPVMMSGARVWRLDSALHTIAHRVHAERDQQPNQNCHTPERTGHAGEQLHAVSSRSDRFGLLVGRRDGVDR